MMGYHGIFEMWLKALLIFTTILSTPVQAYFRHLCHGQLFQGRVDPIVSPGRASQHVHNVQGAQNFGLDVNIDELMASNCTTCQIRQDKSAYWSPQLYFEHKNGTLELVATEGGLTAYYFTERPDTGDEVHPFPAGFRMITGSSTKRSNLSSIIDPPESSWGSAETDQAQLAEKGVGFNCLNYAGPTEGSHQVHYMRDKSFLDAHCPQGVRAEIMFPSCWNGKDLDSQNHKSHIMFPSRLRNGPCPPGFPVRMPVLFFETIYLTNTFAGVAGRFVLANGDPTGYGYHADFLNGWEEGVMQRVIDNRRCTTWPDGPVSNGIVEDCPVFESKIPDDAETLSCKMAMPEALEKEEIHMVENLPGNVPIQEGPEPATVPPAPSRMGPPGVLSTSPGAPVPSPPAAPTPLSPPPASSAGAPDTNSVITKTSVTVSGGTAYHWLILEEIVTTTVVVDLPVITGKAQRHAHGRSHGHRHGSFW